MGVLFNMIEEVVDAIYAQGYVGGESSINATLVFVDQSFTEMEQWQGRDRQRPRYRRTDAHTQQEEEDKQYSSCIRSIFFLLYVLVYISSNFNA